MGLDISDFHELLEGYGWLFEEEVEGSEADAYLVAATLIERGSLLGLKVSSVESLLEERFSSEITCWEDSKDASDLCVVLGISFSTWRTYVRACLYEAKKDGKTYLKSKHFRDLRPLPLPGGSDLNGPFLLKDVLRLRLNRELSILETAQDGRLMVKHLFPPRNLEPLEDPDPLVPVLRQKIQEVLVELEAKDGAVFEHPAHLPRTANEILLAYRSVVNQVVRRRLKYGFLTVEDAVNDIWLRLLDTDILRKFLATAPKKFPPTITVDEAVAFFGISWDSWCSMVDNYPKAPTPLKGSSKDPDALLDSNDVLTLDYDGYFLSDQMTLRRLPEASVTLNRFENYLRTAADNAMKNLLRTQDRRYNRESTQSAIVLSKTGDVFRKSVAVDENAAWEVSLRDEDPLVDEVLDGHVISRILWARKMGVHYESDAYAQKLQDELLKLQLVRPGSTVDDLMKAQGLGFETPEYYQAVRDLVSDLDLSQVQNLDGDRGLCFFKLLADGYSVTEAVEMQREYEEVQTGVLVQALTG